MTTLQKKQLAKELNVEMTVVMEEGNMKSPVAEDELQNEQLEELLDRYRSRLHETQEVLKKTRRELTKTNRKLEMMDVKYQESLQVADKGIWVLEKQLFRWLTKRSQHKTDGMLKYYHQVDRIDLLNAMMTYVVTGKKKRLVKPIAEWHLKLFCEMVDEDRCTVPSHSLLKRLWEKIGLLKRIED